MQCIIELGRGGKTSSMSVRETIIRRTKGDGRALARLRIRRLESFPNGARTDTSRGELKVKNGNYENGNGFARKRAARRDEGDGDAAGHIEGEILTVRGSRAERDKGEKRGRKRRGEKSGRREEVTRHEALDEVPR